MVSPLAAFLRSGAVRLVLVAALIVLAFPASPEPAGPPTTGPHAVPAAPGPVASLVARAVPGDQELSVTWRYARTGDAASRVHLVLSALADGASRRVAEAVVQRTVEPGTYRFPVTPGAWQVVAVPANARGFGGETSSNVVTVTNGCAGADLCASIVAAAAPPEVGTVAQGFLFGLTDEQGHRVNGSLVEPLDPQQWRFSGPAADASARRFGVSRTQILSDLWHQATGPTNAGFADTPWAEWDAWQSFVTRAVTRAEREGWAPDYWDVWNEPNGTCCPRFSVPDQATITVDRWLETYDVAWRAIKAADPRAKVVGPSLSALQWGLEPRAPAEFDLDTFLQYSADHGLRWDAISWHENNLLPSPGDAVYSLDNVSRHIALAKAVIARHPGTVVAGRIFVNEYAAAETHLLAGWDVGYFAAFETSGVHQANRACWDEVECAGATLNGLLTPLGEPTAGWWAHRLYADLGGADAMTVQSSASWQLSGLATRDDSTRTVRVLLGRHWSCNAPVNSWCHNAVGVAPASLRITIAWPYGPAASRVEIARLPAGTGALPATVPVGTQVVSPDKRTLTVLVPTVDDGDAISVVASAES